MGLSVTSQMQRALFHYTLLQRRLVTKIMSWPINFSKTSSCGKLNKDGYGNRDFLSRLFLLEMVQTFESAQIIGTQVWDFPVGFGIPKDSPGCSGTANSPVGSVFFLSFFVLLHYKRIVDLSLLSVLRLSSPY